MSINERTTLFINTVTVPEILKKTDLGQSGLYKIGNGGGVSALTIEKLCQGYPNLSIEWLIYGIGEMWKTSTKVEVTEGVIENLQRRLAETEREIKSMKSKK